MIKKVAYALDYAKRGWPVLPLHYVKSKGKCSCGKAEGECKPGKHPLATAIFKEGYKSATLDAEVIKKTWAQYPEANIGWVLGKIIVVDQDNRHGGEESSVKLEAKYGPLPRTVAVLTGSGDGSKHRYYLPPNSGVAVDSLNRIDGLPGLELKTKGYVVGVGSITKAPYVWELGASPDDMAIASLPDWLVELSKQPFKPTEPQKDKPKKDYPELTTAQNEKALTEVLGSCAFLGHCIKDATALSEPEWQAMIELLVFFGDPGIEKIHEFSSPYPTYSEEATNRKIASVTKAIGKKQLGPYTCQKIEHSLGFGCPPNCLARISDTKTPVTAAIKAVTRRATPPPEPEERPRRRKKEEMRGLSPDRVNAICDKGWLRSYIFWAARYTDAPLAFHLATGLSMISTALGNKVSARAWGRNLYPNLWIVVVSPSGFYRKTTAIRLGLKIFKRDLGELVLPSEWSREKLIGLLSKNPAGLFEWDEFSYALGMMSKDYMVGSKETLTKLFDSMDTHSRVTGTGGQSGSIENPAPNILGGTTIEWLQERVKDGDLRGGFMSRFLFVPGTEKEAEKDFNTAFRPDLEDELANGLREMAALKGEVDFSSVHEEIKDWVRIHEMTATEIPPELMGFIARGETYLLKLCMVIAAGSHLGDITIDKDVFERTALLLDSIKEGVASTVSTMLIPKEGKELERMRELLRRYCPMTKRDTLWRSNLKARNFDLLFNTLLQTGEVDLQTEKSEHGHNKTVVVWKGD